MTCASRSSCTARKRRTATCSPGSAISISFPSPQRTPRATSDTARVRRRGGFAARARASLCDRLDLRRNASKIDAIPTNPDRDQAAPELARARARVLRRQVVQAVLRAAARVLAVGRSARARTRSGSAAGGQARRDDQGRRTGRALRDPADVLRRPRHRDLFVGLSLRSRRAPGRAVAALSEPARVRRREPRQKLTMSDSTHFGYQQVGVDEKAARVRGVFDSVARNYDLMNDLMSAGLHRYWKRFAVEATQPRPGMRVLDLAGGTGDMARLFADRVAPSGEVVLTDINGAMLEVGRDRLHNKGRFVPAVQCDAEKLPFPSASFDRVSIAFGLRNVTHKEAALAEMRRMLRPGGIAAVLEFSRVWAPLAPAYDWYSFNVLPRLGAWIAKDAASYRYLAESIRMHPDQATLAAMMEQAGFDRVEIHNITAGVVALHLGYAY